MKTLPTDKASPLTVALVLAALSCGLLGLIGCASNSSLATTNDAALAAYVQGVKAYNQGDTDAAVASLQTAINKKNDLVMARSILGDIYRARLDNESAKQQYEVLTHLDPYDFFNHYRLGLVYQLLEQFTQAATSYLRALALKPDDPMSNSYLGIVYLSLDKPQDALPYVQKAVQHGPNNAAAWFNLGMVLDANGMALLKLERGADALKNFDQSATAYRKALDLDSNLPLARLYLGESLLQQAKFGEARSVLAELVKVEDTPLHRKRLGDAHAGEQRFNDAIEQYLLALKLEPNYYPALNEIGATHIKQYQKGLGLDESQRKKALEAWQQSLSIKRNQPDIIVRLQKYAKAPSLQP